MNAAWTSAEDVAARVRRRWDDGSLLRSYANAEPFAPIEVPLRGPTLAQIGDDIAAARDWVVALDGGRGNDVRYALEWKTVGGRQIGRNAVPIRAVVSSYEQAWTLLGVVATVRRFDRLLTLTAQHKPVRDWIASYPHRALSLVSEMPRLVAAYEWLDGHRHSQRYLRELSAPGSIPSSPSVIGPIWLECLVFRHRLADFWLIWACGPSPVFCGCAFRRRWAFRYR